MRHPKGLNLAAGALAPAVWLLLLAAGVAAAQDDGGRIGVRLLEAPADRADDPRASLYVVDHVQPGDELSRRIQVVNTTEQTLRVDLYPGAADVTTSGFVFADGRATNELTSWIAVRPSVVSVPSGGSVEASIEIAVPEDGVQGERYAVVWAEPPGSQAGAVRVVNRVGIRVYLSVGEGPEPPTDFVIDSLVARRDDAGVPIVQARVANTGGRAVDLTAELTLTDGPAGLSAGPFATDGPTTLGPGQEGSFEVALDPQLPAGPWLARMAARSGTLEKAVEATIVFPDGAGESSEPVEATEVPLFRDRGVLLPLAIVLVSLLTIGLALFWWFVLRRRSNDDEDRLAKKKAKVGG